MFLSHVTRLFLPHTGRVLAILFLSADHFDASGAVVPFEGPAVPLLCSIYLPAVQYDVLEFEP